MAYADVREKCMELIKENQLIKKELLDLKRKLQAVADINRNVLQNV